jgi:acetyl-CoA acetyltransferase
MSAAPSGFNDGAAALLLASERAVARHGLTPLVEYVGAASAGVAPRVMGIGPVPAVTRPCERQGLAVSEIDLIELNEAFAAQAIATCRALALDPFADHINPRGGAIALGHPLGHVGRAPCRHGGAGHLDGQGRHGHRHALRRCRSGRGGALATRMAACRRPLA